VLRKGNLIPEDLYRTFRSAPSKLLILLILADIGFILVHILHEYTYLFQPNRFSIERDQGLAESFQYLKEFWITVTLLFFAVRKYSLLILIWSGLFFYLMIDDVFRIHEKSGYFLSSNFDIGNAFNMPANDIGQFIWAFIIGAIFLIPIGGAY